MKNICSKQTHKYIRLLITSHYLRYHKSQQQLFEHLIDFIFIKHFFVFNEKENVDWVIERIILQRKN